MGCLRSITAKEISEGTLMPIEAKQYTRDELYALNEFLKRRDDLTLPNDAPIAIRRVAFDYYILRDFEGLDWMTRKEGNNYNKLFCLESWKRFSFGPKQPRYIRQRELKNEH